MNKILLTVIIILAVTTVKAQENPATVLASKIAQKMKDSLSLTTEQMQSIYTINMQLHQQKMAARQQYAGNPSLGNYIQKIENTRDSLYRPVLTDEKYQLYKSKKRNLVSNN
ncbi:MAG: hypothetical protein QM731_03920 [Chitinophagaceae bacterium]